MVLFYLLLIGLIIYLVWGSHKPIEIFSKQSRKNDDAIDLLKRRYINGDIDEETYENMRSKIDE